MNRIILLIFIVLISCDDYQSDTTFLPNIPVNVTIDLNLPEGNDIVTNGFITIPNKGVRGVIIFNNGLNRYRAFDLACPHIALQDCSTMVFEKSDLFMTCPCDDEAFSKIDGSAKNGNIQYAAREYTVSKSGSILTIRN